METVNLSELAKAYYQEYGQRKAMGTSSVDLGKPHFFLHRTFLGDQDLLVIFNTKRCRYQCDFCQLQAKSSSQWIPSEKVTEQFEYVLTELKHSLSVLTRVTIANEGSVLDLSTFPGDALVAIVQSVGELRLVRKVVIESRLEFCSDELLSRLKSVAPRVRLDVLTGFETLNEDIRNKVLFKRQSISQFLNGLDVVSRAGIDLTCYILFKPDPRMSDPDAIAEAKDAFAFLQKECISRKVPLTIRLNPMYAASGSKWADLAQSCKTYSPPKLTDVMRFAEEIRSSGVNVYIGLSTEGMSNGTGTYMDREDYSPKLIRPVKLFNDGKINSFVGTH